MDQEGLDVGAGIPWTKHWRDRWSKRWAGRYSEIEKVVFDKNMFVTVKNHELNVTARAPRRTRPLRDPGHRNAEFRLQPAPGITRTAAVHRGEQVLHFTSTPPMSPRVGGSYEVSASAGAPGTPVAFAIAPGTTSNCVLGKDGTTVSFVKAGTCTIRVNQVVNAIYESAVQVSEGFTIEKT